MTSKFASLRRAVRAAFEGVGINPMVLADLELVKDSEVRVWVKQLLYSREFVGENSRLPLNTRKEVKENDRCRVKLECSNPESFRGQMTKE